MKLKIKFLALIFLPCLAIGREATPKVDTVATLIRVAVAGDEDKANTITADVHRTLKRQAGRALDIEKCKLDALPGGPRLGSLIDLPPLWTKHFSVQASEFNVIENQTIGSFVFARQLPIGDHCLCQFSVHLSVVFNDQEFPITKEIQLSCQAKASVFGT